jgi:hypothetical protein
MAAKRRRAPNPRISDLRYGPLPHSDRNAELQEHSLRALNGVLPVERFVFRPEEKIDAGVDGTIEIKYFGDYTGMRSYVQIKSCEEPARPKRDGSIAFSIERSNLNYLLNSPCPLYVLFLVKKNELRYVWAWDEINRIKIEKPEWHDQKTVTLHFKEKLNSRTVNRIYERIRSTSTIDRGARTILSRATATQSVTLHVDKGNETVADTQQIRDHLLAAGFSILASGHTPRALQMVSKLSYADQQLPKILVIRAYAEYLRGRYQLATGLIQEASLHAEALSASERHFLEMINNICDHNCGRISSREFQSRCENLASGDDEFALCCRIEVLRERWLSEADASNKRAIIDELGSVVEEVLRDETAAIDFKIQSKITLSFMKSADVFHRFLHAIVITNMRAAMGLDAQLEREVTQANDVWMGWLGEANKAAEEARLLENPRLYADSIHTRAVAILAVSVVNFIKATDQAEREKTDSGSSD